MSCTHTYTDVRYVAMTILDLRVTCIVVSASVILVDLAKLCGSPGR